MRAIQQYFEQIDAVHAEIKALQLRVQGLTDAMSDEHGPWYVCRVACEDIDTHYCGSFSAGTTLWYRSYEDGYVYKREWAKAFKSPRDAEFVTDPKPPKRWAIRIVSASGGGLQGIRTYAKEFFLELF